MKESALLTSSATAGDGGVPDTILFRKGQYKVWALSAIVLLALWSMFTGTVNLKWSAGNLNQIADNQIVPSHDDLDILVRRSRRFPSLSAPNSCSRFLKLCFRDLE